MTARDNTPKPPAGDAVSSSPAGTPGRTAGSGRAARPPGRLVGGDRAPESGARNNDSVPPEVAARRGPGGPTQAAGTAGPSTGGTVDGPARAGYNQVGANVRERRNQLGMSRAEFARQAGMSATWVLLVENGHRGLQPERLAAVAGVLGVQPADLLPPGAPQLVSVRVLAGQLGVSAPRLRGWVLSGYLKPGQAGGSGDGGSFWWPAEELRAARRMAVLVLSGFTPEAASELARTRRRSVRLRGGVLVILPHVRDGAR